MGPFGEEDSTCWRQAYGVIGILAVTPHSLRPTQLGIMDFVAGGVRERLNRHGPKGALRALESVCIVCTWRKA